jgi:hypothetical protein
MNILLFPLNHTSIIIAFTPLSVLYYHFSCFTMSLSEKIDEEKVIAYPTPDEDSSGIINVSGHVPVLEKEFNLLSACATGITTGNTWTALGGAIV